MTHSGCVSLRSCSVLGDVPELLRAPASPFQALREAAWPGGEGVSHPRTRRCVTSTADKLFIQQEHFHLRSITPPPTFLNENAVRQRLPITAQRLWLCPSDASIW